MRIFLLFCALGALLGCRSVSEPSGTAIALFCSTDQGAKTESLTVGEEVAVFACPEGTEDYFLEAAKFLVGSDGRSLNYGSTVYYPDPKQAVTFTAYLPFGGTWDGALGTFSVPADQSTAKALKQADLRGAVANTTPVAAPVALEFRHLMARLVITTNEPTTRISFPNAIASGVLHAATAELVLGTAREDIWTESTTGNELIVPVQPLSRLVLTVADTVLGVVSKVEYVFDGSVSLEAGKTTTLDLTLHPSTKTATLSGSSVTDWGSASEEGNPTQAVSNTLLLHWPTLPQGTTPDQVVFTIGGTDYTVSNGITYANHTFTVSFTSSALRYPYTISKIRFYQAGRLVQSCANLIGGTSYKSGTITIGINPRTVKIGDLIWATGNLVASNATAGARGEGGCRIGAPADGGLYFQFGSLIGYKGGDQKNGGTGGGMPQAPLTTNGAYWNGVGFSWASDAMVWPTNLAGNPTSWPQDATTNQWYFGLQTDWSTAGQNIRDFLNFSTGGLANVGVGDPCSYYLGGTWRLPTTTELASITGKINFTWITWITDGVTGRWATASDTFGSVTGPGAWFGAGLNAGIGTPTETNIFFPASGFRHTSNGFFSGVTANGNWWSSSVGNAVVGSYLTVNKVNISPQYENSRSLGFPVRCVSE